MKIPQTIFSIADVFKNFRVLCGRKCKDFEKKKKNLKESHIKSGGIFTCRVLVFGYSILKRVLRIRQFPKANRRASRDEPTVDVAVSGV